MNWLEVILLIIGIVVFVVSFFIPDRKTAEVDFSKQEKEAKERLDQEVRDAKERIQDTVDETVSYSIEKTERSLDRLTNEKIMAVNEYSDTVLAEIKKNYDETVFLYSMLNDKHTNIKNTAITVEQAAKEAEKTAKTAEEVAKAAQQTARTVEKSTKSSEILEEMNDSPAKTEKTRKTPTNTEDKASVTKKSPEKTGMNIRMKDSKAQELPVSPASQMGRNNNDLILQMHNSGKSNMAIAKELGLGIGEVKLVIDLFRQV